MKIFYRIILLTLPHVFLLTYLLNFHFHFIPSHIYSLVMYRDKYHVFHFDVTNSHYLNDPHCPINYFFIKPVNAPPPFPHTHTRTPSCPIEQILQLVHFIFRLYCLLFLPAVTYIYQRNDSGS